MSPSGHGSFESALTGRAFPCRIDKQLHWNVQFGHLGQASGLRVVDGVSLSGDVIANEVGHHYDANGVGQGIVLHEALE